MNTVQAGPVQPELTPLKIKANVPEKKNKTKQKNNGPVSEMHDSPTLSEQIVSLSEPQTPIMEPSSDTKWAGSWSPGEFKGAFKPKISIKEETQDDESEASVAAGEYIKEVALAKVCQDTLKQTYGIATKFWFSQWAISLGSVAGPVIQGNRRLT